MKTIILIISTSLFGMLTSLCSVFDEALTMQRRDYTGNELRTDGYYYYCNSQTDVTAVLFLYRNGITLSSGGYFLCTLDSIEKRIVAQRFNLKSNWGVFIVNGNTIQYEKWIGSTGFRVCLNKDMGYIINDTTIHFKESYFSEFQTTYSIDEVWHFKQFAQKPDSTNNFIK